MSDSKAQPARSQQVSDMLEKHFGEATTAIRRDLMLNLQKYVESSELEISESYLVSLAVATSVGLTPLMQFAREQLIRLDFTEDQIQEAGESAAIMGMLNMYYRFRHIIHDGQGHEVSDFYKMAGLRMTSLGRPVLGKERFEMLALAVSVVNGCSSCINSHERVLREAGVSTAKIHDVVRIASVIKGLKALDS